MAYVPSEMIAAGIIMNNFVPAVSQLWWAILFGLLVTVINLFMLIILAKANSGFPLSKLLPLLAFAALPV